MMQWLNRCHFGDCLDTLRRMPDGLVQTCVTSPPYYGLRDYGHPGQIGLEDSPEAFVAKLVDVFHEVRRVLRDDGTLWLNLGDTYAQGGRGQEGATCTLDGNTGRNRDAAHAALGKMGGRIAADGLKTKDLIGIPWMVAFALRADGWYLRQDIIWSKPNPMPESVRDRCTKAHEYVFLLSKSERYYFDQGAIAEQVAESTVSRLSQDVWGQAGSSRVPGKTNGPMRAVGAKFGDLTGQNSDGPHRTKAGLNRKNSFARTTKDSAGEHGQKPQFREDREPVAYEGRRNKRSVWTVSTRPYKGAHFAVFPPALIQPCILAGAPAGGVVLDPFFGSGTTGEVAEQLGRAFVGCELNAAYEPLQTERLRQRGMVLEAVA
jgi:DNA modification methylase